MEWVSLFLILTASSLGSSEEDAPKVRTPLGAIRGYYGISNDGRQYQAFEGIPYAVPPTGKLRFKPPQRVPAWQGELVANKFGPVCLQYSHLPMDLKQRVEGAEDCLYLNVYAPLVEETSSPLPVLFWIHGGAFQYGSGSHYGPKFLLDRDVVVVTFNYRLGPFGFLSTEDEIVPGNMGLKDQNSALLWVSENIEWFGGDPKRVTLVGQSAGGASVHYHYLTALSKGLFQGGISISGTAMDCWTQTESSLEKTKKLASILGCPTINNKEMVRCLKYRPAHQIAQAVSNFMPWLYNPYTPFGPVVEKAGDSPFLTQSPAEVINSRRVQDVPWITGVVSEEGLYPAADFVASKKLLKELNDNWENIAPHLLDFNFTIPHDSQSKVARAIKEHYLGSKPIDGLTVKQLVQMIGDRLFVVDAEKAARLQAKVNQSPVWFYYFTYRAAHSLSEHMSGSSENFGVSHCDDLLLVMDTRFCDMTSTAEDRAMQKELLDLWVSFAYNRIPDMGINWPKLDSSMKDLSYLHVMGPSKLKMESKANLGEKEFWKTIDFNENKLKRSGSDTKDEF